MSGSARVDPGWRTPCCDRMPQRVHGDRFVCAGCGCLYSDPVAVVRRVFGPGVTIARAQRRFSDMVEHDALVDRWCDA